MDFSIIAKVKGVNVYFNMRAQSYDAVISKSFNALSALGFDNGVGIQEVHCIGDNSERFINYPARLIYRAAVNTARISNNENFSGDYSGVKKYISDLDLSDAFKTYSKFN